MNLWDARTLADRLLAHHGLAAAGWKFKWDRATRRFGCCNHHRKTISLSLALTRLNPESQVRDTLLHEIAHALTPGHGHNRHWKKKCVEIGATPLRCFQPHEVLLPPPNKAAPRIKAGQQRIRRIIRWLATS
ncbi:MAG TPA: SprT-like domain-containing protein [Tepidisphaeraceae bacterium]|nr:SprT-like domain-containing protein [Tepidisphaeraceae bacterium]